MSMNIIARSVFHTAPACATFPRSTHRNIILRLQTRRIIVRSMASNDSNTALDKNTSEDVWKKMLNAEEYHVIRQKGTERPFTERYKQFYEEGEGVYVCRACNTPLYNSDTKFHANCGWPALYQEIPGTVERHTDTSGGMVRTEITCANCGGHLGHEFLNEGFPTPTNSRHCVNYVSIKFVPKQ